MPATKFKQPETALRTKPRAKIPLDPTRQQLRRSDDDDPMDKDDTEIELEKLLFGDTVGFHESLKAHDKGAGTLILPLGEKSHSEDGDESKEEGLEGVDDADVRNFNQAATFPHLS